MSQKQKILEKFLSKSGTFTYSELKKMLNGYGYKEMSGGKTSGSRTAFINYKSRHIIRLHKPHSTRYLKKYQMDYIENELLKKELL